MAYTCENHSDRPAKWLRDSWVKRQSPMPVCDECKKIYEQLSLSKHLNVRPISGGMQGKGGNLENNKPRMEKI
jgi:hypothetical protein